MKLMKAGETNKHSLTGLSAFRDYSSWARARSASMRFLAGWL